MPEANEKGIMIRYQMQLVVEAVEIHTVISFSTQQVEFQFSTCAYF